MDLDLTCIAKLSSLLRENGDKVLNSQNKLSLTVFILENLNKAFSLFVEDRSSFNSSFEVTHINNYNDETVNSVQFLYDFVQRVESLKISQNVLLLTNPSQSVNISKFKNLKYLELRKVHIWDVTGIQNLCCQLQSVICIRCITKISDFLQCCGGDRTTENQWNHLCEAVFSYNSISSLDPSLRLAPLLQVLDISHNRISNTDGLELLENLKYLNLGYNALDCVPVFHKSVHQKLQVLILRNNFIEDLSGLFPLEYLVELDLSCNCIVSHDSLLPLSTMTVLTCLSLEGNPLYFVRDHRMYSAAYLSQNAVRNEFLLNRLLLSMPEKMVVGTVFKSRFPLRCSKVLEDRNKSLSEERKPSTSSTVVCEVHATQNDDEDQELLSSSVPKSNKKVPKKKGRAREAIILEKSVTDRESELTASTSMTDSLTMSEDDLETKKKVEMLRKKFGKDHWLHSEGGSCLRDVLGMQDPTTPILPVDIVTIAHDMVLDSVSEETKDREVTENKSKEDPDNKNEPKSLKEQICVSDEATVHVDHVDSKVEAQEADVEGSSVNERSIVKEEEVTAVEEEIIEEEEEEEKNDPDEDESQMYIVQPCSSSGDKHGHEIFLVVTDSHVKEREMSNAKLREKWALDTLLSCGKLCSNPVIIQLTFDTVRPSRQERNYITDENDSQKLLSTLGAILESRNLSARNQFAYRCMKCSTQFSQEITSSRTLLEETEPLPKGVLPVCIRCPACGSTVVIQMDEEPLPSGASSVLPDNGTCEELDAEDALVSSCVRTTSSSEISVTKSSSQSSIGASGGGGGAMLQVTAIIHQPASDTSSDVTAHNTSSAASLDQSPKQTLVETGPIKRWESDIDILSNPSQSSIEVLDENNRTHGNTPVRKRSSEERQSVVVPAAPIPSLVSAFLGGLTESSSSGSLTDSICTTYKTSPEDENCPSGKKDDSNAVNNDNNSRTQNINVFNVSSKHQDGSYNYDIMERRKVKLSESSDDTLEGTDISSMEQENGEPKGAGISYSTVLEGLLQSMSSKIPIKEETCPVVNSEEIQFSYTDLSVVDHRLKLYLYMHMFEEEQEELIFLMRCHIICRSSPTPFLGLVVFSTHRVYILRITGRETDNPERWLQKVNTHPSDQLTEIQKLPWHQGLGLGTRNGNNKDIYVQYLLIVQDQQCTLDFLTYISGLSLPEKCALTIHSVLERNILIIQQTVLSSGCEEDGDTTLRQFVIFSRCSVIHNEGQKDLNFGVLMITGSSLIVTQDNLEWMLPESAAMLTPYKTQPMSNLLEIEEKDEYELTLHFLDSSDTEESWAVTVPTRRVVEAIIEAIRSPWEQLFSVQLQIAKK